MENEYLLGKTPVLEEWLKGALFEGDSMCNLKGPKHSCCYLSHL